MFVKSKLIAPAVLGIAVLIGYAAVSGGRNTSANAQDDKKTPGPVVQPANKGDDALRKRADEFVAAFDKGDAKAVAGFWTPDADYIDQTGRHVRGRKDIQKVYEKLFAGQKGAKLVITPTAVKLLTPDVTIEDGVNEVTPADGGPGTVARYSAVLVRMDGQWFLESVRESVANPPSNAEHFDGLEWLIGEWAGEAEKGEAARATYDWAENRNYLVSSFATTLNGIPVAGGTQWIGWDPTAKQVRSWSFYSGGGFGEGTWAKDGDRWTIKTTATTADGKKVAVTNVLTRVDADHATWQPTGLTVDGKAMPDSPAVKLKRVKSDPR